MSNTSDEQQKVLDSLRENCSVVEHVIMNKHLLDKKRQIDMFIFRPKDGAHICNNNYASIHKLYLSHIVDGEHERVLFVLYRYDKVSPSDDPTVAVEVYH